ncbi:MAG: heme-binding protein [Pseudomonadota bacterium]
MRVALFAACLALPLGFPAIVVGQYAGPIYTEGQTSETPAFEVIASGRTTVGRVEVRRYASYIAAQVTVEAGSERSAAAGGFGPLANYIFGGNAPGDRISMTEPVATAPASSGARISMTEPVRTTPKTGAGAYIVQFMMPSEWTMDTLPAPLDPRVSLVDVPARTLATLRWSGGRSDTAVSRATDALTEWIEAAGLRAVSPVTVAQYDSPSVARERQRWEVQIEVTEG